MLGRGGQRNRGHGAEAEGQGGKKEAASSGGTRLTLSFLLVLSSLGLKYSSSGQLFVRGLAQPLASTSAVDEEAESPSNLGAVLRAFQPVSSTVARAHAGASHTANSSASLHGRDQTDAGAQPTAVLGRRVTSSKAKSSSHSGEDTDEATEIDRDEPKSRAPDAAADTVRPSLASVKSLRVFVSNDSPSLQVTAAAGPSTVAIPAAVVIPHGSPSAPLENHLNYPVTPQMMEQ